MPVRLDGVSPELLPSYLTLLHWAELDQGSPHVTWAAVAVALQADPEELEQHRRLAHLVEGWVASGRAKDPSLNNVSG